MKRYSFLIILAAIFLFVGCSSKTTVSYVDPVDQSQKSYKIKKTDKQDELWNTYYALINKEVGFFQKSDVTISVEYIKEDLINNAFDNAKEDLIVTAEIMVKDFNYNTLVSDAYIKINVSGSAPNAVKMENQEVRAQLEVFLDGDFIYVKYDVSDNFFEIASNNNSTLHEIDHMFLLDLAEGDANYGTSATVRYGKELRELTEVVYITAVALHTGHFEMNTLGYKTVAKNHFGANDPSMIDLIKNTTMLHFETYNTEITKVENNVLTIKEEYNEGGNEIVKVSLFDVDNFYYLSYSLKTTSSKIHENTTFNYNYCEISLPRISDDDKERAIIIVK